MKRQSFLVLKEESNTHIIEAGIKIFWGFVFVACLPGCSYHAKAPQVLQKPVYLHQVRIGMTGEEMDELAVPGEIISKEADKDKYRCWLVTGGQWKPYICTLTPGPPSPEDPNSFVAILTSIELDEEEMERVLARQQTQALQQQIGEANRLQRGWFGYQIMRDGQLRRRGYGY